MKENESMENKDLIFRYNNIDYKLLVSDTKSGSIRLRMKNIENDEINDVTLGAIRGNTPDCVVVVDDKKLIDRFLETKIFDYSNDVFAKINIIELEKYAKKEVKEFVEKYSTIIEYRTDIGNTEEDIKKNIKNEARNLFKNKKLKQYFKENYINMNSFMYSVLDKDEIKESFAVFCDEYGEYMAVIRPYRKDIEAQVEILREYNYNDNEFFFSPLNRNCEIIQINNKWHSWLMCDLESKYPNFEYKNGVKKYIEYCLKKGVDKYMDTDRFMTNYTNIKKMLKETKIQNKKRKKDRSDR